MECLPKSPVLNVTEEHLYKLRQSYGLEINKIREDINAVKEWMKKENHLQEALKYMSDTIIERIYYLAKGSLQATKTRIDKLLTTKYLMPDLCINRNMSEFEGLLKTMQYIILPKLNPNNLSRICIMRFLSDDIDSFNSLVCLRYMFMLEDYIQNYDFGLGISLIVDYKNLPLSFVTKINPLLLKKSEILLSRGYSLRFKGLYYLNAPYFMDIILLIAKSALSEKLARRIKIYEKYEDLHKDVPKEILPQEYGGYEPPCAQISETINEAIITEEGQKIIANAEKMISNESKRISLQFNEEYLGMPGSFRALSVD